MLILAILCIIVTIFEMVAILMKASCKGVYRQYLHCRARGMDPYVQNSVGLNPDQLRHRSIKDIKRSMRAAEELHESDLQTWKNLHG